MQQTGIDILLVEDNPGDARLIEILLAKEAGSGVHVTRVGRLVEALALIENDSFDAVLLDLNLPDSRGLETLESVRKTSGTLPIVVLSGHDDQDVALGALQSGAQDYLIKGRVDGDLIKRSLLYSIERQRTKQHLHLAEAAFSATDTVILVLDTQMRIVRVNPAFSRLTGYERSFVEGRFPTMLHLMEEGGDGESSAEAWKALYQGTDPQRGWEGELWCSRSDGGVYPVWARVNEVHDDFDTLSGYVMVLSDLTHRKQIEAELMRQATCDPLTGLPNRTLFMRILAEAIARPRRGNGIACGLLFVDLDGFKDVNDTYGHEAGDAVLIEVGNRLKGLVRSSDEVARLAGDEFVVVLPDLRRDSDSCRIASKIVENMALDFDVSSGEGEAQCVSISASVGIALAPQDGTSAEGLLQCADSAMYYAKRAGKNRWALWRAGCPLLSAKGGGYDNLVE